MSTTKSIPTIASIAEGDSLVIKHNGSVCSAPLSTLVAPKAKQAEGVLATKLSVGNMTSNELKDRILAWVQSSSAGAIATITVGDNFDTAFKTDGAQMPGGSAFGFTLLTKTAQGSFALLGAGYSSDDIIYIIRYTSNTWGLTKIVGTH